MSRSAAVALPSRCGTAACRHCLAPPMPRSQQLLGAAQPGQQISLWKRCNVSRAAWGQNAQHLVLQARCKRCCMGGFVLGRCWRVLSPGSSLSVGCPQSLCAELCSVLPFLGGSSPLCRVLCQPHVLLSVAGTCPCSMSLSPRSCSRQLLQPCQPMVTDG